MNAYQKAQQLGLIGTDEEIVAALKAYPRHHRNVYITGGPSDTESVNLLHLLTARHRVMGMGAAQQWVGPLIDLEANNQQVAMIMSLLRPMLQVNDTLVYCKDSTDAANMLNALGDIVSALTGKPEQVAAEVALLSGGRIGAEYSDLTVEQYAAQKQSTIDDETRQEVQSQVAIVLNEIVNPAIANGVKAEIAAAFRSAAAVMESAE